MGRTTLRTTSIGPICMKTAAFSFSSLTQLMTFIFCSSLHGFCESFSIPGALPASLDFQTAFAAHSRGCGLYSHTLVLTTDLDSPCSRRQTSECCVAHVVGFNDSAASAPLFDSLAYFLHGVHYFDIFQCLNSVCGKLIVSLFSSSPRP